MRVGEEEEECAYVQWHRAVVAGSPVFQQKERDVSVWFVEAV